MFGIMDRMIFIYLLLAVATAVGLWVVGSLLLVGHLFEAVSILVLVVLSGWCAGAFARRTTTSTSLPFVGFCLAISLEMAAHMAFGLPPDGFWAWLNLGLLLLGGPFFLDFVTRFPVRRTDLRWLVLLAYGVAAALAVVGATGLLVTRLDPMDPRAIQGRIDHFHGEGPMYGSVAIEVMLAMQAVALLVLWNTRRDAIRQQDHRVARQALVLILGVAIAWAPTVVFLLDILPTELDYWFHAPPAVFMALIPLAGASALRHPEFYDHRGLFRLFLIGVGLVSGAYLIYLALVRPFTILMDQVHPGFGREMAVFGAALVVAFLIRPIKQWMAERVDRLFFPHLLAFRTLLQEVSQVLATTIIPGDVASLATKNLPARLGVSGAVLLVLDDLDASLISLSNAKFVVSKEHPVWIQACRVNGPAMVREAASCKDLDVAAPALVLPLRVGGRLVGVYVLGARQPGVEYTREELAQLMMLAHHLAVAVENGRALRKIDELSQRALTEVEERNRLAREIHDTIAQGLTAASLQLDVVEATLTINPARAAKATERAQSIVRSSLAEARRSVLELRAPLLGTESLPVALTRLMNQAAADVGASGSFRLDGPYRVLPARIEHQFYRIAQEALHNAVKYSSARNLIVNLHIQAHRVSLTISDDGAGFDTSLSTRGNERGGFGLTGMGERARLLGGQLRVISEPGQGTMVKATVPLPNGEGEPT